MKERIFLVLTPIFVLSSPMLATIFELSLPLFGIGEMIFLAGVVMIGLALGLVAAFAWERQGIWPAALTISLTVTVLVFLDIVLGGATSALSSFNRIGILLLCSVLAFYLIWKMREKVPFIAFSGASAFLISTLLVSPADAKQPSPPTIYIIMDEMTGLAGIDQKMEGGTQTYRLMQDVFLRHGFRLFGNAYSRHFFTARSIPATLAFDFEDNGAQSRVQLNNENDLKLFKKLLEQNEKLVVYQTAHLNYCKTKLNLECHTFQSFNPKWWKTAGNVSNGGDAKKAAAADVKKVENFRKVHGIGVSIKTSTQIIGQAYGNSYFMQFYSQTLVNTLYQLRKLLGGESGENLIPQFFDIHGFENWFSKFEQDVFNQTSNAYFAHFLIPHSGYVMNANCEVQKRWGTGYYLKEKLKLSGRAKDEARAKFYKLYYEQVQCALNRLDEFLTKVASTPALKNAKIVIHGDHGSRISSGMFSDNISERDMIDNFSTIYAIKSPDSAPGLDSRITSVQRLTAEHFSGLDASALGPDNRFVVVSTKDPKKVDLRTMPDMNLERLSSALHDKSY